MRTGPKCRKISTARANRIAPAVLLLSVLAAGFPSPGPEVLAPLDLASNPKTGMLYVINAAGRQVAVVDPEAERIVRTIPLPEEPAGLATAPDGSRLYVAGAAPEGRIHVVDPESGSILHTFAVGHTPCAVVPAPDGRTLYVCSRFGNAVKVMDAKTGNITHAIPVSREPVAAGITPDGRWLLVANHLPSGPADGDYAAAEVTMIDAGRKEVAARIFLPNGSTGLRGLCLSPDGKLAFVTHILSRYHLPTTQLERGWMNTNALSIIDVKERKLSNTVLLDDVDLGAANPWGVACRSDGALLVVAHAGTNEVSIIDLPGLLAKLAALEEDDAAEVPNNLAFLAGLRRRVPLAGTGPRGIAVAGGRAYLAEYFTDSLGIVDLKKEGRIEARSMALRAGGPESLERRGEMLFNDARLCFQHWQSCASCHPDGRADGLNWDLLNDGFGNPKNTKSLLLAHRTPPAMITGARDRAEAAVRAGITHILFTVRPEEDARAIDAYLKSMKPVASPRPEPRDERDAGTDSGQGAGRPGTVSRGRKVFEKAGCITCHPPPLYTDMKKYDLGLGKHLDQDRAFDTPTLVEIWRTAPYLYDGRAATIREVLSKYNEEDRHGRTSDLAPEEIADLEAFILSL